MPKNQITLKKSQSAEEFQSLPDIKQELTILKAQNQDLRIQISELDKLFQTKQKEHEQIIAQFTQEKNDLTDVNIELRIQRLKDSDALKASQTNEDQYFTQYQQSQQQVNQLKLQLAHTQKALTYTQQDLKSAQRIVELRLNKEDNNHKVNSPHPNY